MDEFLAEAKEKVEIANELFESHDAGAVTAAIIESTAIANMFSLLSIADDVRKIRMLYEELHQ